MLNKKQFAELLGVTAHTVTRWEKGDTDEPSTENIRAISSILDYPESFFSLPELDFPQQPSFRSQTSMSASVRDAALSAGSIGFLLSDWIEERFNLPAVSVPDLHQFGPDEAARVLREEWQLGEAPISNMLQLLESKGVRVFSLAENTVKVNAFSLWRNDKPFVFLNNFKSAESSRFDAAHELGHLVLHQDGGSTGREAEDQANRFASSFLMPRSDVLAKLPYAAHLGHLIQGKVRWRVSLAALNYRMHKIGLLTDWKYRDFCIQISKNGYHKEEPNPIGRERSVVWEKVFTALWQERITQSDIARDLSVPEDELRDLVFGVLSNDRSRPSGRGKLVPVAANTN